MKLLFENWRQYVQESKGSKYKELLRATVKGDKE